MVCRGTFNICFSTTYILVWPTVFEQHDAEGPKYAFILAADFDIGLVARAKNWIFVT